MAGEDCFGVASLPTNHDDTVASAGSGLVTSSRRLTQRDGHPQASSSRAVSRQAAFEANRRSTRHPDQHTPHDRNPGLQEDFEAAGDPCGTSDRPKMPLDCAAFPSSEHEAAIKSLTDALNESLEWKHKLEEEGRLAQKELEDMRRVLKEERGRRDLEVAAAKAQAVHLAQEATMKASAEKMAVETKAHAQISSLTEALAIRDGLIARHEERLESQAEKLVRSEADTVNLRADLHAKTLELEFRVKEEDRLTGELARTVQELELRSKDLQEALREVEAARREARCQSDATTRALQRAAMAEAENSALREARLLAETRLEALSTDLSVVREEETRLKLALESTREELATLKGSAERLAAERHEMQDRLNSSRALAAAAAVAHERSLQNAESQLRALPSALRALAERVSEIAAPVEEALQAINCRSCELEK